MHGLRVHTQWVGLGRQAFFPQGKPRNSQAKSGRLLSIVTETLTTPTTPKLPDSNGIQGTPWNSFEAEREYNTELSPNAFGTDVRNAAGRGAPRGECRRQQQTMELERRQGVAARGQTPDSFLSLVTWEVVGEWTYTPQGSI